MARIKAFINDEYCFSIPDILDKAKEEYGITSDLYDGGIAKHIQRYMKEKPFEFKKDEGKKHFFKESDVNDYLENVITERYYRGIAGKDRSYATNKELLFEQTNEQEANKEQYFKLLKKVGLTVEEANYLQFDRFNQQKYLYIDELEVLGKKGLQLRNDLTKAEKEILEQFEIHLQRQEQEEKEIQELFYQKKMEIMITALFNEKFNLRENLLLKDISNYVRCGEYASLFKDSTGQADVPAKPSMAVRRSFIRLQQGSNYFGKKRTTKDK